jgi:hypothetical protein
MKQGEHYEVASSVSYILVNKSVGGYDSWSSVDNPYGPGGVAYDGPEINDSKKRLTMANSRQNILPQHDTSLDETTGWEGVDPISAIRYMGDYRAGSPVPQGDYQTSFEGAPDRFLGLPGKQPDVDFNAPTVEAPHGKPAPPGWKDRPPTSRDDIYPDKDGWLHRDPETGAHYWYKNGVKNFMDVQEGTEGSWWSHPTEQNFDRAAGSTMVPKKVVALRGDPNKYGTAHRRDSDVAREKLAEMFLEHDKDIPPEALVEVPMRENVPGERNEHYMDTARRMGIPRGKHPIFDGPTRWSDRRVPFGPSRTGKKLEDVPDAELYRAEPMDIAFQLLKYATVQHLPNPKLIGIRRIAEQNLADNTSDPSEWSREYSPRDPRITLNARDKRRKVLLGATGRQYETQEHLEAVEGETDDNDYDKMYNEYYSNKSEPIEIVFQLLKERKSPEAWANKKRYDSEYQKTPRRVKYREQLNAERRKRGIYGKGGADVSHTQGGKLTLESPHANRARHFKGKGTLRRVKVR